MWCKLYGGRIIIVVGHGTVVVWTLSSSAVQSRGSFSHLFLCFFGEHLAPTLDDDGSSYTVAKLVKS